ncbi:hypothetical protein [Micromonospora chersina]|uniref:hypothetical protein n=1 Tax=Micromonospora chersina TaxID=47854 RepID=UPI003719B29C
MALVRPIRLAAAAALALSLAACESDAPTQEEATSDAQSVAVRQASASAATRFDEVFAALTKGTPGLRPVATATSDTCRAGATNGLFPHDTYRLQCHRSEVRYFGARGDLLDVLREVDAAAKRAGLIPNTGATLEGVEAYYRGDGKTDDGRLLPLPLMNYLVPGFDGPIYIGWSQAGDPRRSEPAVELSWPIVFQEDRPVDVDSLWSGRLRGQKYLITFGTGVTYHEVPWPD